MKANRRNFLKQITAGSIGLGFIHNPHAEETILETAEILSRRVDKKQYFNMCGYRAPKLDIVRVGFIGIGNRGYSNLQQMTFLEGVRIEAICDIVPFRIDDVQNLLKKRGLPEAKVYTGSEDAWKRVCAYPSMP